MKIYAKKWIKRAAVGLFAATALCFAAVLWINATVLSAAGGFIITPQEAALLDADCILVLGSQVTPDGLPRSTLEARLAESVSLYELGASPKLLMTGDHGRKSYDEVNVMKNYAIEAGVPSEDIFMDHAGFSTYESMYRARDVFQAETVIIVSQEYHLYRSIYIGQQLGLTCYGVASDRENADGQRRRNIREILARTKDFFQVMLELEPTYLGEAIPVSGNGDLTND